MIKRPLLVAFELSNWCNYAGQHPLCPVNAKADPVFLPAGIVEESLKYLGWLGFNGELYFSIYNEPLIDPRLFMFIKLAKQYCPGCRIQLFTNGWNLDQQLIDELLAAGVGMFMVSAYTDSEERRLRSLDYKVPSESRPEPVMRIDLDDRMGIYRLPVGQKGQCWLPSIYSFINHKGEFVLCCHDYEYRNVFGNLHFQTFEEVYTSSIRQHVLRSLEQGNRIFDVCERCNRNHLLHDCERDLLVYTEE